MSDKRPQTRNPQQQQVRARAVSGDQALQVEALSGLLPHPEMLREYEAILPGAAERLLQLAEREQANRNGLEKEDQALQKLVIANAHRDRLTGLWVAAVLALLFGGSGIACAFQGQLAIGLTLVGATIGVVVNGFLRAPQSN